MITTFSAMKKLSRRFPSSILVSTMVNLARKSSLIESGEPTIEKSKKGAKDNTGKKKKSKTQKLLSKLQPAREETRDDADPPGEKSLSNRLTGADVELKKDGKKSASRNIFETLEMKVKLKNAAKKKEEERAKEIPMPLESDKEEPEKAQLSVGEERDDSSTHSMERKQVHFEEESLVRERSGWTTLSNNSIYTEGTGFHLSDWRTQLLDNKNDMSNKKSSVQFYYIESSDSIISYESALTSGTNPFSCLDLSCT